MVETFAHEKESRSPLQETPAAAGAGVLDEAESWRRLAENPRDTDASGALVQRYTYLVESELRRARNRFPRHVDLEELHAAAQEGLFLALFSFRPSYGLNFETYARKRVWGSILDRMRGLDGVPRTARRANKLLTEAQNNFVQRVGRRPDHSELAAEVGVATDELGRVQRQALASTVLSLDAVGQSYGDDGGESSAPLDFCESHDETPLSQLTHAETKAMLVQGLKALPERERSILVLYYNEGIMFTEIAAAMEVSESRISQLHARALERLKRYLTCRRIPQSPAADAPAEDAESGHDAADAPAAP